MASMGAVPVIDPAPLIRLLTQSGGEVSFEAAIKVFQGQGMNANDSRDAVWRLLSQGIIEFTTDRTLRLPNRSANGSVAG